MKTYHKPFWERQLEIVEVISLTTTVYLATAFVLGIVFTIQSGSLLELGLATLLKVAGTIPALSMPLVTVLFPFYLVSNIFLTVYFSARKNSGANYSYLARQALEATMISLIIGFILLIITTTINNML